jgi:hypothetical protein
VEVPDPQFLRALQLLSHNRRRLVARPCGNRNEVLDTVQLERAVRHSLVYQHLGLLDIEGRIEEGVVLEMEAHRSVRWVLHAVGGSRVARGNRDIHHFEFRSRGTDARDIAIHRFTEAGRNDPRDGHGIGCGHLRASGIRETGEE